MPESAVAEPPAATETPVVQETAGDRFEAVKAAHATNAVPPDQQQAPPVDTPSKAKAEPAKTGAAKSNGNASDIPEQFLTGEAPKDEKTEPEKESLTGDPDMDLLLGQETARKGDWALVKKKLKDMSGETKQLRAQLEATQKIASTKAIDGEEIKKAQAEVQRMQELLEKSDFQQSPRFQKFLAQEKSLLDAAKANLKGTEVDAETIELAARAAGQMRRKILEDAGVDASLLPLITPYLARLDELNGEKAGALENYKTFIAEDKQRARAREEQSIKAQIDEAGEVFDKVLKSLIPKLAPLQKLDPDKYPEWNQRADEIPKLARQMFTNELDLDKAAELAIMGASALQYMNIAEKLQGRLKEANATIAKLTAGQPGAGSQTNGQFVASNDASVNTPEGLKAARIKDFDALRPS